MQRSGLTRQAWRSLATVLCLIIVMIAAAPPARAHAEMRASSPAAGATVGGEFHSISMQFFGLHPSEPQSAELFDPAGNKVESILAREDQRLVLPIEPLTVPGEYTVNWEANGIDGDFTTGTFSFRFDPDADEPEAISLGFAEPQGFDWVNLGLLMIGAGLAAFLLHRFMSALREHRAAQG